MHLYLYCICICIFFCIWAWLGCLVHNLKHFFCVFDVFHCHESGTKHWNLNETRSSGKDPPPFSSPVPWLQDWWAVLCVLQPWHHPFMPGPQWIMTQNMQMLPKEGFMIYGKKAVRCQNWIKTCPFPDHWVISQGRKLPQSQIDIEIYIYILIVRLINWEIYSLFYFH